MSLSTRLKGFSLENIPDNELKSYQHLEYSHDTCPTETETFNLKPNVDTSYNTWIRYWIK
jgi:hypothetical protein